MDTRCATFETLLARVQGRLAGPDEERVSSHVAQCPRCAAESQAIEATHLALGALSDAELRAARSRTTWAPMVTATGRPDFLLRLPPAVAGVIRTLQGLAQPAAAGAFAALILGVSLGTWLAFAADRVPAAAESSEPYSSSSLLDTPSAGIASAYLGTAEAAPAGGVSGVVPGAIPGAVPGAMHAADSTPQGSTGETR